MGNTTIPTQSYRAMESGQSKSYIIPFALLCSLFFLWAVANNLNDILLPQFQQAFTLTNFQDGLIQSAFYFGYFIIPIPAGMLMKKFSYKAGILTGLFLYACGAALFWPAAEVMNYTLFLIGLFIIAAWKPRPTRLSPSSVRKAAVTSALIWPRPLTHSAPLLPWYLARVLFCLTSRISRRRCWIK
jgi:MFS family permease